MARSADRAIAHQSAAAKFMDASSERGLTGQPNGVETSTSSGVTMDPNRERGGPFPSCEVPKWRPLADIEAALGKICYVEELEPPFASRRNGRGVRQPKAEPSRGDVIVTQEDCIEVCPTHTTACGASWEDCNGRQRWPSWGRPLPAQGCDSERELRGGLGFYADGVVEAI